MWYEMKFRTVPDTVDLVADVVVPASSPWFDGHFPDGAVLPGIAQLAMVFDLIRQHAAGPLRIVEVNRVRFKRMLGPDQRLTIVAAPRQTDGQAYTFRLEAEGEVATTGSMTVAARP